MVSEDTLLLEVNDIAISLFTYPYSLIKPLTKSEYLNIASLEDIAAMKMIAIIQRGIMRDFIDLYFLLKKLSLENVLKFAKKKYPGFNEYLALQSLTYFEYAEKENNTRKFKLFLPFDWAEAKQYFIIEARRIKEKWGENAKKRFLNLWLLASGLTTLTR